MNEISPERIIDVLGLVPLVPEGGYVNQTWLDERASAIYYLMTADQASGLHRLEHLEVWAWHAGAPARMLVVDEDGLLTEPVLGPDLGARERPQVIVPGGAWQAAESLGAWTLVSTFMAPPYADDVVTFARWSDWAGRHPAHEDRIRRLCRE